MIIGLVRKLGEIKLSESENVLLQTYIESQNPYKLDHLFALEVDLDSGEFKLVTEEYDPNKELLYLRGIQKGHSENLSPVLNIKPNELTKNAEKVLNLNKFPSRTTLFEKQGLNPEQFPIYQKLLEWFEIHKQKLSEIVIEKIREDYLDIKNNRVDRRAPTLLIFKVKIDGKFLYPAEIDEFKIAYLHLATPPTPEKALKGLCMACAQEKFLTPTKNLNMALFEFFSIDLNNFVLGMESKNSNQLTICIDCQELLKLGLSVLETELKFKAYTRKINSKNTLFVEHSLLPTAYGRELVADVIKSLSKIRKARSDEKKTSIRKDIENIQQRMARADRKAQRELKKRLREFEEELGKVKDFEEIDERIVLEKFVEKGVSYIDLYYIYESVGVGNYKKVFMDLTFVNATFLKKLLQSIRDLEKRFSEDDLLTYWGSSFRFEFSNLYSLFSIRIADLVRKAMLTGIQVPEAELARDAFRNLRDPFLKLNANIDKNIWINRKEYHKRLNTFLFVHQLLTELKLLKE